jgi:monoamine oxidase
VERLEWGPWGVRAFTADGRVYPADRAVVALPLGVLKAEGVRFVPELPEEKRQAIERLGLTDAVKLFFRFDRPVFPPGIVELYAPGAALEECWSNPLGHSKGIEVLTALATGEKARALMALPEERALREALQALQQALGQPSLTPSKARLVHWRDDPYTLGAYSMARVGASEARQVLAKPVGNRLFFAGEHTAPNAWASTVHGAYASGKRAAHEAIRSAYREAPLGPRRGLRPSLPPPLPDGRPAA